MKEIEFSLNTKSIQDAIKEIRQYQKDVEYKTKLFAEKVAQRGVEIAKGHILDYQAFFTYELYNSITYEKIMETTETVEFSIVADSEHAVFVEFGTGIIGKQTPHPLSGSGTYHDKYTDYMSGEKIIKLDDGRIGWVYYNDKLDKYLFTEGMPSRPFMYETSKDLQVIKLLVEIAKEVFG